MREVTEGQFRDKGGSGEKQDKSEGNRGMERCKERLRERGRD